MKQIAQYQDGRIELQEVPVPAPPPGGALVRTLSSVISVGTEKMKVEQARMNLLQKARARPDQVRKVLQTARTLGWQSALEKVRNRLETPTPLGYSAAGEIVAVDDLCLDFRVGDLVACAGAECAFHAEYLAMPPKLMAKIPQGVPARQAAYTTVCSIALQAVRQAELGQGAQVAVVGQGLIGILLTNLLEVGGVRVLAVDLLESRREICLTAGAELFCNPGKENLEASSRFWTEGRGLDAVFLCTATSSNKPVEDAAQMLRDRGRLVVVGNTRVELEWKAFYGKEIDVRYSRSYGPGRYDATYEWGGVDYPPAYVRWTEQRNMDACLHLMSRNRLRLEEITSLRVPLAGAIATYEKLVSDPGGVLGVVIEYGGKVSPPVVRESAALHKHIASGKLSQPVRILHVLGAGNFARTMLLPHLRGKIPFGTIVNQTALSSRHVREKFGFQAAGSKADEVLAAADREAVMIATRHNLHAPLVTKALLHGCHVFVEKPLCLEERDIPPIVEAAAGTGGSVMVGFNRRFAPVTALMKRSLEGISGPKTFSIIVNAGPLDPSHWYANAEESGGRILGEACHFFDMACFLASSEPRRVTANFLTSPLADMGAQVEFADGSVAQIIYTGEGSPRFPKETLVSLGAGFSARVVNFLEIEMEANGRRYKEKSASKGHAEEMAEWAAFLQGRREHPLPLAHAVNSMLVTFAALRSAQNRQPVTLSGPSAA